MSVETPPSALDQKLEAAKNSILTPEQYLSHPAAKKDELFYVVEAEADVKKIAYVGCRHTVDPNSPVFASVRETFKNLKPQIVFVEGMHGINENKERVREKMQQMSIEEAMRQGESMYALKLAVDAGIDFESPEPDDANLLADMQKLGFTKEELFLQMFYRTMHQYLREHEERSLEACKAYLAPYFAQFRNVIGLDESIETQAYASINLEAGQFYGDNCDPIPWPNKPSSRTKEASAAMSLSRDKFALGRIAASLKKYDRVMVTFGRSHAISLEPGIRALLSS
jgi:hypothetical protein